MNDPVNKKKRNSLFSAIIFILIVNVGLQIWFLYGALNNALDGNPSFAWATFAGSAILFAGTLYLFKYFPK